MPPRTLASLAHALAAASDLDAAIVALGEALAEVDRSTELSLFGSVLREDFGPESDVDFLVTFEPNDRWSLWDLISMQNELEGHIGRKVDLIEKKAIRNPYFWDRVISSHRVLYAA